MQGHDYEIYCPESARKYSAFSHSQRVQCSELNHGSYVMINGRPCRVIEMPKVNLIAQDVFNGEMHQNQYPLTQVMDIPYITSKYYRVVGIIDSQESSQFLICNSFEGQEHREDIKVPHGPLGVQLLEEMHRKGYEVYCTVLFSCGEKSVISVHSFPEYPDFQRLPFEMKQKIFSYLENPDLQNVRLVCTTWSWVIPITSLVRFKSVQITQSKGILVRLWLPKATSLNSVRQIFQLSDVPSCLLANLREIDMQEVANQSDLNWILENCHQLRSINVEYPTAQMMASVPELIFQNESSLETISLWDFYWYNSSNDAFDCAMLENCRNLQRLKLFAKHIKNIDKLPRGLRCLKIDNLQLDKIQWMYTNLRHLKELRFDIVHDHHTYPNAEGMTLSMDQLKGLLSLPNLEQLDLNFVAVRKWDMGNNFIVPCQTVKDLENFCKLTNGIQVSSDTWGTSCTLEVMIDRDVFKGFVN